ncbi:MAG TPA: hypothetical protein PLP29_00265 [Candidatus Ozemobacteraceae bacterium]|nr:hypothetical protein [Candidatus Ozemobacteraceae bacterium]
MSRTLEGKRGRLVGYLQIQFEKSASLEQTIKANLKGLGYDVYIA